MKKYPLNLFTYVLYLIFSVLVLIILSSIIIIVIKINQLKTIKAYALVFLNMRRILNEANVKDNDLQHEILTSNAIVKFLCLL